MTADFLVKIRKVTAWYSLSFIDCRCPNIPEKCTSIIASCPDIPEKDSDCDGGHYIVDQVILPPVSEEKLLPNIVCGIIAGIVSSSMANPTDVLKVRDGFSERQNILPCGIWNAVEAIYLNWMGTGEYPLCDAKTSTDLILIVSSKCENVNDRFNVWNHWQRQFRPTGSPSTSLFTDEASVIKFLA